MGHTVVGREPKNLCGGQLLMMDVALSRGMGTGRALGDVLGLECSLHTTPSGNIEAVGGEQGSRQESCRWQEGSSSGGGASHAGERTQAECIGGELRVISRTKQGAQSTSTQLPKPHSS